MIGAPALTALSSPTPIADAAAQHSTAAVRNYAPTAPPAAGLAALLALLAFPAPGVAQHGALLGIVRDSVSGDPVPGVVVALRLDGAGVRSTLTDEAGRFEFRAVAPGRYGLTLARIGYHAQRTGPHVVAAGESLTIVIQLVPRPLTMDPLIVSVSRVEQKALAAPASISVVSQEEAAARPALTVIDHVYALPGVDVAATGLTQHEVVARGFGNVASGALLTLTDYRYASLPSLRINAFNFIPLTNEDIARIELVRGPGAALYGPNAANGVLHVLTQSPLEAPGTVLSLAGGERRLAHGSLRHAPSNDGTLGFHVSAQYLRGDDWRFEDPTEVSNRALAIAQGADADTLLVGRRSPAVERLSGAARLDWRPASHTAVTAALGVTEAIRNVDLTPLGAAQVRNWRSSYGQIRFSRDRLFAQAFVNTSDAGETYLLRTGQPVVDRSEMWVGQVQHGTTVAGRHHFTYGLDLQRTVPKTDGTITGRNEGDDTIDEAGAYVHGETRLASQVDLVAALRVDHHNRLPQPVYSPRAALVWRPGSGHGLRLTYNRAFGTPTTNNLFLDLFADSIRAPTGRALPFAIRVTGVPKTGFTFRRDCDGPCMRSPFTPAALGGPAAYIPADGTLLWQGIIDTLKAAGLDLSRIPPPSRAQVATRVLLLDGLTGARRPVTGLADIPPLRPVIHNTMELGYKGVVAGRVQIAADLYRSRINNFIGPPKIETANAFFDSTSLAAYLADFLPPDSAGLLAGLAQRLPLGTISPEEARDPWDLLITYRNFGDVTIWGADLEVAVALSRSLTVRGTYSWVSDDFFPNLAGINDVALNAPAGKGAATLTYRDDARGWHVELRGRGAAAYPVNSGVYVGTVEGFVVFDALAGARLRRGPDVTLTASAQNLLGRRHQEFLGAPEIGRLVVGRVRVEF